MERGDAEEYTQALGQVVAGGWRQVALGVRLGVPAALEISTSEWVEQRLGGYIRLSIPERREAIKELVEDGFTQQETADIIGVSQKTVSNDGRSSKNTKDAVDEDGLCSANDGRSSKNTKDAVDEDGLTEQLIRDESSAATSEAADEQVSSHPTVQDAKYMSAFAKAIVRALDVTTFDPEKVVALADESALKAIEDAKNSISAWASAVIRVRDEAHKLRRVK